MLFYRRQDLVQEWDNVAHVHITELSVDSID